MKVTLTRANDAVHFEARTESGALLHIDGAPSVGGQGLGARPMETVLTALGGCSAIDVVSILTKQRESIAEMVVTVDGERDPDATPSLFRSIHVHFSVSGPSDADKVARAVSLSMEKYCSVARILEGTATITFSHELVATRASAEQRT
ncbi:MAG TPA: OsmC family protein [Gemmatimonadales bacterium]|nr:OsmC family protein [Gemmatimonadales bacterium]